MKVCEILSVGTELLLGDVVDTNASYLSQKMKEVGYSVLHRQTCGDNEGRLSDCLRLALSRSDLVLVTGGLGPTYDDITREVTASVLNLPLEKNRAAEEGIRSYFARRGIPMSENNLRQAMVPCGAEVLQNDWGTAPGLWMRQDEKGVILLPGVPREMKALMEHRVLPILRKEGNRVLHTLILHCYGISESLLDEQLGEMMRSSLNPTLAPYAVESGVELHITAAAESQQEAESLCLKMQEEIRPIISEFCYAVGNVSLEEALVSRFAREGITVSVAESCTGGLVAERITSVAGSSRVFRGGVISYWESVKQDLLGVKEETLRQDGVYSRACAVEMAEGVRRLMHTEVGIGITGIAGPDGGTQRDPVGCVYLAVSSDSGNTVERVVLGGTVPDRDRVRRQASSKALAMALTHCGLFREWK